MNAKKRRDGRGAATRDRILRAAVSLFSRHGYAATTTAAVARKANVNEALIFRHFPRKRRLYEEVIRTRLASPEMAAIVEAAGADGRPLGAYLAELAAAMLRAARRDPAGVRLYYFTVLEGHPMGRAYYRAAVADVVGRVAERIARAAGRVRARAADRAAAEMFVGLVRSEIFRRALFGAASAASSGVGGMVAFFLAGLGGTGAAARAGGTALSKRRGRA